MPIRHPRARDWDFETAIRRESHLAPHHARKHLVSGMSSWRDQGLFTDLTIRCLNGDEYKLHKIVVCPQSQFFHNACKPDSPFIEAQTGVIKLEEDDPMVVKCMVQYLYDQEYRAATPPDYTKMNIHKKRQWNLSQHLECYFLADKYDIMTMRHHAASKIKLILDKESLWAVELFPTMVKSALENTPESDDLLRPIILDYCYTNLTKLMANPEFHKLMDTVDDSWRTMASKKAGFRSKPLASWAKCPKCGQLFELCLPLDEDPEITCFKCGEFSTNCDEWFELLVPEYEYETDSTDKGPIKAADSAETESRKRRRISADD